MAPGRIPQDAGDCIETPCPQQATHRVPVRVARRLQGRMRCMSGCTGKRAAAWEIRNGDRRGSARRRPKCPPPLPVRAERARQQFPYRRLHFRPRLGGRRPPPDPHRIDAVRQLLAQSAHRLAEASPSPVSHRRGPDPPASRETDTCGRAIATHQHVKGATAMYVGTSLAHDTFESLTVAKVFGLCPRGRRTTGRGASYP